MTLVERLRSRIDKDRARLFGVRIDMWVALYETIRDDRKPQVGLIIVAIFGFTAIFSSILAPYDPMGQDFQPLMEPQLVGPHPLGTDSFGRDLLSRIIYGSRISLLVGVGAVALGALVGTIVGLLAGYFGGWIDDILMRSIDVIWAFPAIVVALMLVAIFGQSFWNVIIALGYAYIDDFARVVRSEVLAVKEEEYALAAKTIGLSNIEILYEEIFPNVLAPAIVIFTILVARAMIGEATLTFLGIGVGPTTPTWGALITQGRDYVVSAWWIALLPGLMIVITVFGINLLGDALRDAFDVKEQG